MNLKEILEAGEPDNPSRRSFLRKIGAAAAVAAHPGLASTVGTVAKGTAASVLSPASAVAATTGSLPASAIASALVQSAGKYLGAAKAELQAYETEQSSLMFSYFRGSDTDEIAHWIPGVNDETAIADNNKTGTTPWGKHFFIGKSPSGVPFLVANTGYIESLDNHGLLSFFDKNGEPITIEWRPSDNNAEDIDDTYSEDEMTAAGEEVDEYLNNVSGPPKNPISAASDIVKNDKSIRDLEREEKYLQTTDGRYTDTDASSDTATSVPPGIPSIVASAKDIINNATGIPTEIVKSAKDVLAAANTAGSSSSILPTIARLAAVAAVKLKQYVNKPFDKEQDKQEPIDMGPVQYADDDKPLALPAPDKTPDMLTPELQRMKDLAGIKQKKK
jgi:hypothetical protein